MVEIKGFQVDAKLDEVYYSFTLSAKDMFNAATDATDMLQGWGKQIHDIAIKELPEYSPVMDL